jgi:hypothetical protein
MNRRTLLLCAAGLIAPMSLRQASAQTQPPVNVLDGGGIAIHGYDPVAYFVEGGPRKGRPEFAVQHRGARWLFASEANKKRFEEEREKYLPAYGGYCAYGVAQGYLVKIDPTAWRIVDNRLYLNYDRSVARTWAKDIPGYVTKADTNWPELVGRP